MDAFIIPFLTILLAEFLDKSQLSLLLLASRTKKHVQLLIGSFSAFILLDGSAVFLGSYLTTLLPLQSIRLFAGLLFILFGVLSFFLHTDETSKLKSIGNPLLTSFSLIALSELGDKTQLAAAAFSTKYEVFSVFLAVMTAQLILAIIAIYFGKFIGTKINKKVLHLISGLLFMILGIVFITS